MTNDMSELLPGEEKYVDAMRKVLTDDTVKKDLEADPLGTMERLGFNLSEEAKQELRSHGLASTEVGLAALPAVVVRVATNGTRPAVSVVVRSSTIASTRGIAAEISPQAEQETK